MRVDSADAMSESAGMEGVEALQAATIDQQATTLRHDELTLPESQRLPELRKLSKPYAKN